MTIDELLARIQAMKREAAAAGTPNPEVEFRHVDSEGYEPMQPCTEDPDFEVLPGGRSACIWFEVT